jgi:hypothetical protein
MPRPSDIHPASGLRLAGTGVTVAVLAIVVGACSSSGSGGVKPGAACTAAGGQCQGDIVCEFPGPQDCGLGGTCCFQTACARDRETDLQCPSAADASGEPGDASADSPTPGDTATPGPAACVAAGGQCVSGVGFCANVGPGATPQSCFPTIPDAVCCAVDEDAGCTEIQAAKYDQSCATDSDCTAVSVGNACYVCEVACGATIGAINVGALAQYMADFNRTPAGNAPCGCGASLHPPLCCRGGQCHADNECLPLDGSADAMDVASE